MISLLMSFTLLILSSCSSPPMKINRDSIKPGGSVLIKGKSHKLYKGIIKKGQKFSSLIQKSGIDYQPSSQVTIVSIVPSIDTKVCEEQTHILGETKINPKIRLVTISRDLPMAQKRFASEAKLENIDYFSDYKFGRFGRNAGILIQGKELLSRGVLVLDQKDRIQYFQFVSEVTELPDMKKAFEIAESLLP